MSNKVLSDLSNKKQTIVYSDGRTIKEYSSWDSLFFEFDQLPVLKESIFNFLKNGFVLPPYTLFKNVYLLTIGDELNIENGELVYRTTFPFDYFKDKNRKIESEEFFQHWKRAVKCSMNHDGEYIFMQSAGKDSSFILEALYKLEMQDKVRCVTYESGYRESEGLISEKMATDKGFTHLTVKADPKKEYDIVKNTVSVMPNITADLALIPYLHCLQAASNADAKVIDGMGGDIYMGFFSDKKDKILKNILKITNKLKINSFNYSFKSEYLNYLNSSLSLNAYERIFPGTRLFHKDTMDLLSLKNDAISDNIFNEVKKTKILNSVYYKPIISGRLNGVAAMMEKPRLASNALANGVIFPFCDYNWIDYYNSLSISERLGSDHKSPKHPIKKFLSEKTSFDKYIKNKGSFRFDVSRFISENKEAIIEDILNCSLWKGKESTVLEIVSRFDKNDKSYVLGSSLYTLFIISLWLNKSMYISNLESGLPEIKIEYHQ
ncbi:hypothetical protein MZJ47_001023 [Vibrio parahaemolyticus]|nr:hypothetical protein [Vibrio parahaemolyticus]EJF4090743.1 hypothetical protein [Vibrio parahaemolyticus]EJG0648441.1 hypothetical protein [Vibrio parahaemolyticus]EJG0660324.1 hypothetical protein [Vibrio parahaemolyticus]